MEGTTLSAKQMADFLGVSTQAVRNFADDGLIDKVSRGKYDLASVSRYIAHLRETASGRGGADQVRDLTQERARLAAEQADAQEMKNEALRGRLIEADAVEREWGDMLRRVRAGVLAVSSRMRQVLPHLTAHDVGVLDGELRRALEGLANDA